MGGTGKGHPNRYSGLCMDSPLMAMEVVMGWGMTMDAAASTNVRDAVCSSMTGRGVPSTGGAAPMSPFNRFIMALAGDLFVSSATTRDVSRTDVTRRCGRGGTGRGGARRVRR